MNYASWGIFVFEMTEQLSITENVDVAAADGRSGWRCWHLSLRERECWTRQEQQQQSARLQQLLVVAFEVKSYLLAEVREEQSTKPGWESMSESQRGEREAQLKPKVVFAKKKMQQLRLIA